MASITDIPTLLSVLKKDWANIIPLIFLVWMIVKFDSVGYATIYTTALVIVLSWFKPDKKIGPRKIIEAMGETIHRMIPVTMACAAAGMLIDEIMLTGLSSKLASLIFEFTYGSMLLTLLATAILCVIFGMGMPVSSAYILTAALAAPILLKLGVPLMNAHLFIVYYSCLSAITPPVAVAAFAASGIAQADPVKIGLNACRLAAIAFILPFMFVYVPGILLQGDITEIVWAVITAVIGVVALAAAIEGWLFNNLPAWQRILLFVSAACLLVPGAVTDIVGLIGIGFIILTNLLKRKASSEKAVQV